jgi:hypothetical protein
MQEPLDRRARERRLPVLTAGPAFTNLPLALPLRLPPISPVAWGLGIGRRWQEHFGACDRLCGLVNARRPAPSSVVRALIRTSTPCMAGRNTLCSHDILRRQARAPHGYKAPRCTGSELGRKAELRRTAVVDCRGGCHPVVACRSFPDGRVPTRQAGRPLHPHESPVPAGRADDRHRQIFPSGRNAAGRCRRRGRR